MAKAGQLTGNFKVAGLLAVGAVGVVSVASHLAGPEINAMVQAFLAGQPGAVQFHRGNRPRRVACHVVSPGPGAPWSMDRP